jgi:hypothetical protein
MIEARAFGVDIEKIRRILEQKGAISSDKFEIHDTIYVRKDGSASIADEFLRLRVVPLNVWVDKPVIVSIKRTKLHDLGKESAIPSRIEFDTNEEAVLYIKKNLAAQYTVDFSYSRIGWQYILPNGDVADLEIIENKYNSVEIKSDTDAGIARLANELHIDPSLFIKGPSASAVKELLSVN